CPSALKTRWNWAGVSLVIWPCAEIHWAQLGSQPVRLSVIMTTRIGLMVGFGGSTRFPLLGSATAALASVNVDAIATTRANKIVDRRRSLAAASPRCLRCILPRPRLCRATIPSSRSEKLLSSRGCVESYARRSDAKAVEIAVTLDVHRQIRFVV